MILYVKYFYNRLRFKVVIGKSYHHHQVARPSMSIAVSTSCRHFERSCARFHADVEAQVVWLEFEFDGTELGPPSGLGRPLGRCWGHFFRT